MNPPPPGGGGALPFHYSSIYQTKILSSTPWTFGASAPPSPDAMGVRCKCTTMYSEAQEGVQSKSQR